MTKKKKKILKNSIQTKVIIKINPFDHFQSVLFSEYPFENIIPSIYKIYNILYRSEYVDEKSGFEYHPVLNPPARKPTRFNSNT